MQHLKIVYDFTKRSPDWGIMLFPLLLVFVGIGMFYYYTKIVDAAETTRLGFNKKKFGMFFSGIYTLLTFGFLAIIPAKMNEYAATEDIYKAGKYKVVKGRVAHYHPMPEGGHDTERFDVEGIPFDYSDYDLTDFGYNNAASKGGVVKPDLLVRISYFNNGRRNVILKLETE